MMNTPANSPSMSRRLISEEEYTGMERQSYGILQHLMPNLTPRQRTMCLYTVLFALIIIFLILFATSYNLYYTSPRLYMTLSEEHTTIRATSKFGESKIYSSIKYGTSYNIDTSTDSQAVPSSTSSINETSATAALVKSKTSRINHRKWNNSTSVIPSTEVELIGMLASVVNSNSTGTAFHDNSTQSVKSKTIKQKVYSSLTNKFEDISVGSPKRNIRTHKMLMKALKTNEVHPSVVKAKK